MTTLWPTASSWTMNNTRGNSLPVRQQGGQPRQHRRNRESSGFWGDEITPHKNPSCARIGFQNINGLSIHNNLKTQALLDVIQSYEFDYFGVQEVNTHERILPPQQKWQRKFPYIHTKAATNQHCQSTRRILYGGTAHFLNHDASLRQVESGADQSGLGRWIWTRLQGRQGIQIRIISGYRPTEDKSNRPHTVYSQHEYYFNNIDRSNGYRNPRRAFFEDLDSAMKQWLEDGEQIILGMDTNEDIHAGATQQWITNWGLVDAMQHHYPHVPRTATCNKNSREVPIDGIFVSPGLQIYAAGMTGFGELYPDSDHRLLWVEIRLESLFGYLPPKSDKRPQHSLPIGDPKAMNKYNKYVKEQFELHRITEKSFALEEKALSGEFQTKDRDQYDHLLCIQHDIRRRARRKCRRFYTSQILYTDELGILYKKRKLWKLVILHRNKVKVDVKSIRRLMQQVEEPTALRRTLEEAEANLSHTINQWKTYKKIQITKREQFEAKVDKRRAKAKGTSVESQTKQRRNAGSTRSIFRRIKQVMKPADTITINTVEYTADAGHIVECLSRETIEQACIHEGRRRFTQANHTPFMQGSLLQQFGYNANNEATQKVLNGTFTAAADTSYFTQLLHTMPRCIKELPPIQGAVSTQDHCISWKRMRVKTGSSPYGPLYCDYIAGTHDNVVAGVDASLSSIPFIAGFSPTQWQEATDVMIPKKKSSRHVQKLRIIVLFDAMFNMVNKRIARLMIKRAQDHDLLPKEVYGGVPGRCATTCSLNKVLSLDVIRIERRTASVCSNDAKSCYDRIVHTVASICMQRLGVAADTCYTMFDTLQALNHHVRTAYGERSQGYGALQIPLQGVGQGNGAGPAIWLAITIPLVNMLREAGFGIQLLTPISKEECSLACFVYVDDVDSIHSPNNRDTTTVQGITADTQRMLDTWAGGLETTGGMIEASKSYWYLIDFKWNTRKMIWEYKSITDTPATIYLRQPGTPSTALIRREVHDPGPDGTLGTFIAIDGNQTAVKTHLSKQINAWADKIRTKQLTTTEGWLSFRTGISMSIRHQLSTSRLSKLECKTVTRTLKKAILKASGLPITYPDVLVYAPREFLGLGLPNFWHIQATLFAEKCLQHGSIPDDPTGILLRTLIQDMRLEMGVSRSPLLYSFIQWNKCATISQFFPLWEYASEVSLEIHDGIPDIPIARENDSFLMEIFAQHGFTASQLRLLNLCRLHLKVYLLSDLCTGDGSYLDKEYLARRTPFTHHNHFPWPRTHSPNASCWRSWHDAIIKCFTEDHHNSPFRLKTPLGAWISTEMRASTLFSRRDNMIYKLAQPGIYHCFRHYETRRTRNPTFIRTTSRTSLPSDAIPTTTYGTDHTVHHTGVKDIRQITPHTESDWWGIVTDASLRLEDLADAISQGTAVAVTDGSYRDHLGTAAFTFRYDENATEALTFVHMTPGMPHELTPFRAELGGLYGITKFLAILQQKFALSQGSIRIVCDCKGALERASHKHPPKSKYPNFDLLSEIYQLRQSLPFTWVPCWVRGHQDDTIDVQHLDALALLNISMDKLAKEHWNRLDLCRPRPFSLPRSSSVWSIWTQDQRVTSWDKTTQDRLYFNASTSRYWHEKYDLFPEMDYTSIRIAYKSIPLFYQLRVPKWIGRRLPVGIRVVHWDENNVTHCPRCGKADENHTHIISCQHPGAVAKANEWLANLELWLAKQHTHPDLRFGVISILRANFRDVTWIPPFSSDPNVRNTFRQQQRQGIGNIMFGWWATGWAETQQLYLTSISRRTTGYRWLSRLIKKQWEISWDLWKHRMEIASEPTSFSLAMANDRTNQQIRTVYHRWSQSPYQHLRRWFRQPLDVLLQQPLTFKQDWLVLVQSFLESPC